VGKFQYAKRYLRSHLSHPKWWSGSIDPDNADHIAELVRAVGAMRIADYGSGKGYQYLVDRVHERWGGILPHCYDPGVVRLNRLLMPGQFDGLICTDVMEHIRQDDVDDVLEDVFALLHVNRPTFAYFNIFCNLAGKEFSDGLNVHLTVRPPDWWDKKFRKFRQRSDVRIWVDYEYLRDLDVQR
jgi:hypothetical protein